MKELIDAIKKSSVIPVIGFDALKVRGHSNLNYLQYLTLRLSKEHNIIVPVNNDSDLTNYSFVCQEILKSYSLKYGRKASIKLKETIRELVQATEGIVNCKPLEKLAKIIPLKYYINTTFTSFLENALIKHRTFPTAGINTANFPFGIDNDLRMIPDDLPIEKIKLSIIPSLYNLLGTCKEDEGFINFSEDDLLRFTYNFSKLYENRLSNLKNVVDKSSLLLLGCNYPDWLFRFFLYSLKPNSITDPQADIFLDSIRNDPNFTVFINRHQFTLIPKDANALIDELYSVFSVKDLIIGERDKEHIFLSYCWDDQKLALSIADWLISKNKNVWMDKFTCQPGDELDPKIADAINTAKVFCPLVTKASISRPSYGYVRREWSHFKGLDVAPKIVPLVKEKEMEDGSLNFDIDHEFNRRGLNPLKFNDIEDWKKDWIEYFN